MDRGEELVRACLDARGWVDPAERDSLELIELVLDIEQMGNITIPQGLVAAGITLQELVEVVNKVRGGRNGTK